MTVCLFAAGLAQLDHNHTFGPAAVLHILQASGSRVSHLES